MIVRPITIVLVLSLAACSDEPALFPSDYAKTYQEVRNCRQSNEHEGRIRVLASPEALDRYVDRTGPIPVGGILLKESYDELDILCEEPIQSYTVMQRLETGSSPDTLDWKWQRVNADFVEDGTELEKCVSCHTDCSGDVEPFDATCTVP